MSSMVKAEARPLRTTLEAALLACGSFYVPPGMTWFPAMSPAAHMRVGQCSILSPVPGLQPGCGGRSDGHNGRRLAAANVGAMRELERKPHASVGITDRIEVGDCWHWIGRLDPDGYGRFGHRGRPAHRLVWEALVGPIPEGHQLDHLCRNKACVNPDHLEPVLPVVNVRRTPKGMKGRGLGLRNQYTEATHCKRGHEFTPENTYHLSGWNGRGARGCLTCRTLRNRGLI